MGTKYTKFADPHKRAARSLIYALTLGGFDAWQATSAVWAARLTDKEGAALSFAALKSLEPDQAAMVVETVFAGGDTPLPPLLSSADEAVHWASWAGYDDIKACTLAGFNRLTAQDQTAFLDHVERRAA
ncbi:hypothetical protein [Roseovarius aestuarii]|uniref:Uncharacterized protein n=1 Tax=Roseovarius aestuarii TaxID=475083 RepID=A0A1X7BVT7_9RHOB|nr:hypothetical protein [Roseovarius aestuarii]SMC13738.1 hypothetical protein ROA7745_03597 [Roseovarius aestuarii]